MKKLSIFFLFMLFPLLAKSQDSNIKQNESMASVVFYRLPAYVGSDLSMNILMNGRSVVDLKNNTMHQLNVQSGNYSFSSKIRDSTRIDINVEAGKTYYIECYLNSGYWTSTPVLEQVDSLTAVTAINTNLLENQKDEPVPFKRLKKRIGLNLYAGGGYERLETGLKNAVNDKLTVSPGGGFGLGLEYGYELNKYFDIACNGFYQRSSFFESVRNGNAHFDRYALLVTPSFILPFKNTDLLRLFIGGGVGYYFRANYFIKQSNTPLPEDLSFNYKPTIGYHFTGLIKASLSEKYSLSIGLKYYSVKYKTSDELNSFSKENFNVEKPNGSGLDLTMALYYHF